MPTPMKLRNIRVPDQLWQSFAAMCARRDVSVSAAIRQLMREAVDKYPRT